MIRSLTAPEAEALLYDWRFWARPSQLEPEGDWFAWLLLTGRGWGKTLTGAQWIRQRVERGARRIHLVAATAADARDTMVEGETGILAVSPPWNRPIYQPSKRRLTWPSGAVGILFSADEPRQQRGPQCDTAWADELAAWRYPATWDQLMFGLRLGQQPRVLVSTTPRPTPIIRSLLLDATTRATRGSTYENEANLPPEFLRQLRRRYEGTRLGRQELHADVLDDAPGALWKRDELDSHRVEVSPALRTIVIAVDPAVTSGEHANETGIVAVGVGEDGHGYVLEDASGRYSPNDWAAKVVKLHDTHQADRVVAEVNQGGDLVESTLKAVRSTLKVRCVHAARGKRTRAEPVAALYEQGRVHHVGVLAALEDQMCAWEPDVVVEDGPVKRVQRVDSPDHVDALVWGLTDLMIDHNPEQRRGRSGVRRGGTIDDMGAG